jgi:hypothetical protein
VFKVLDLGQPIPSFYTTDLLYLIRILRQPVPPTIQGSSTVIAAGLEMIAVMLPIRVINDSGPTTYRASYEYDLIGLIPVAF